MLTGRFLLVFFIHSTLIIAARTELNNETPLNDRSTSTTAAAASQSNSNQCPNQCSIDYCLQYASLNKNCTKLIRDQCDCCTVCLRSENQTCGGHLNVFGLCEQDFLCQRENLTNSTGICVRGKREIIVFANLNVLTIRFVFLIKKQPVSNINV